MAPLPLLPLVALLGATARGGIIPRASGTCDIAFFDEVARLITADSTNFPGVTVKRVHVTKVAKNGRFGGPTNDPDNLGYPVPIDVLPELCAVRMYVENITDNVRDPKVPKSQYDVGLFLPPSANWNSRILTVGNGGFVGGINWPDMAEGVHHGFSTVSTSTGHSAGQGDLTWAANNTGAQLDWAYRAVHGTAVVGKEITRRYYDNRPPVRSYYAGCSTGGRQGLREIMYDADTFDGLLIGAPAWNTVDLMPWISKLANTLVKRGGGALTPAKLTRMTAEVRRQCPKAGSDVVDDGIISDPDACLAKLDYAPLVCKAGQDPNTAGCFATLDQANAVKNTFYGDYVVPGASPGVPLVSHGFDAGSEEQWNIYFGATEGLTGFDMAYERTFLGNPAADVATYTDAVVSTSRGKRPGPADATAPPFDLSRFRKRGGGRTGGKILMYHGMQDGFLPRKNTLRWYDEAKTLSGVGSDADMGTFVRYFEVPGMQHCYFSPTAGAPWIFGQAGAATALRQYVAVGDGWTNAAFPTRSNDSAVDALAALVQWTEGDAAPAQILAGSLAPARTRPICAYPAKPELTGTDVNDYRSWQCK